MFSTNVKEYFLILKLSGFTFLPIILKLFLLLMLS